MWMLHPQGQVSCIHAREASGCCSAVYLTPHIISCHLSMLLGQVAPLIPSRARRSRVSFRGWVLCAGKLMVTRLGLGGLHILGVLFQYLSEARHVQADIPQQVEDVQCNRPQSIKGSIQMLQLQGNTMFLICHEYPITTSGESTAHADSHFHE